MTAKFLCVAAADFGRPVVPLVGIRIEIVSAGSKFVGLQEKLDFRNSHQTSRYFMTLNQKISSYQKLSTFFSSLPFSRSSEKSISPFSLPLLKVITLATSANSFKAFLTSPTFSLWQNTIFGLFTEKVSNSSSERICK